MCEIVIRILDKPLSERASFQCGKGDIVDIQADNFPWGNSLNNPNWLFIRLPGIDPIQVSDFLLPRYDGNGFFAAKRQKTLNLSKLTSVISKMQVGIVNILTAPDKVALLAAKTDKTIPMVIG